MFPGHPRNPPACSCADERRPAAGICCIEKQKPQTPGKKSSPAVFLPSEDVDPGFYLVIKNEKFVKKIQIWTGRLI